MRKNDLLDYALVLTPIFMALVMVAESAATETKRLTAGLNAGMEWIDDDCVKGERK